MILFLYKLIKVVSLIEVGRIWMWAYYIPYFNLEILYQNKFTINKDNSLFLMFCLFEKLEAKPRLCWLYIENDNFACIITHHISNSNQYFIHYIISQIKRE